MAAISSGPKGRLALLVDKATQKQFLVDTGSSYSIIPHWSQELTSGPCLCTADRSPIACWGDRKLHVAVSGRRFTWPFLLADVALPIIRADFLRHLGLLVDLGEMQLLAHKGGWSQQLVVSSGSGMFATIGGVADPPPQLCSVKKKKHLGAATTSRASPSTSISLPTEETLSSPSLHTGEARGSSPTLQHMLDKFLSVLNTSKVLPKPTYCGELPGNRGPPSHCQIQAAGQQQVGGHQEGVCRAGEAGDH